MDIIGKWKLCGGMSFEDGKSVFLTADELVREAEAEGDKSRVRTLTGVMEIHPDSHIYLKTPLPEGLSQEEITEAKRSGVLIFDDGTYAMELLDWKAENGKFFARQTPNGKSFSPWMELTEDEDGALWLFTSKYERM